MADDDSNLARAQELFDKAEKALEAEEYDNAIKLFGECLDVLSDGTSEKAKNLRVKAHNGRGISYYEKGDYDSAINDYHEAIALGPQEPRSYSNCGNAHCERGEYDLAIEKHNKAIEINPNEADYYSNRGSAYGGKGEYDLAIEDCDRAIELNPSVADFYSNRGNAYKGKGEYDRAIQDYDRAIELNPSNAGFYSNRGNAYGDKGEYDRALQDYDKAIELDEKFTTAHHNRALTLAQREGQKSARIFEKKMEEQLEEQKALLRKVTTPRDVARDYQVREKQLRIVIKEKKKALEELTKRLQKIMLTGFVVIVVFVLVLPTLWEATIGERVFASYFLFAGFVASLYVTLSDLWRMRRELRQYLAAEHDAFRKKTLAQYPLFFPDDEEKRYQVIRLFMEHTAEKSPAEFLLDWREKDRRRGKKKKKDDDCEDEGNSHAPHKILQQNIIQKPLKEGAKEVAKEIAENTPDGV